MPRPFNFVFLVGFLVASVATASSWADDVRRGSHLTPVFGLDADATLRMINGPDVLNVPAGYVFMTQKEALHRKNGFSFEFWYLSGLNAMKRRGYYGGFRIEGDPSARDPHDFIVYVENISPQCDGSQELLDEGLHRSVDDMIKETYSDNYWDRKTRSDGFLVRGIPSIDVVSSYENNIHSYIIRNEGFKVVEHCDFVKIGEEARICNVFSSHEEYCLHFRLPLIVRHNVLDIADRIMQMYGAWKENM